MLARAAGEDLEYDDTMIDIDFEKLRPIGLTQQTVNLLYAVDPRASDARLMRITEVQRDCFGLHDGQGDHRARALQKLLHALELERTGLTVGDWVLVEAHDNDELWIAARLPPVTQIARRANDGRRQPLASNVDTALLVMGLDHDYNPRRMERYIAMVRASGVAAVAVLTKADIGTDVAGRLAQLRQRLPAQVAVVAVNGLSDDAGTQLAPWLGEGQTLVVLGSSGAGKSTLTNTLAQESLQLTGGVRKGDGRGRHTTTARFLLRLPGGACIVDTPGLRTWRADADEEALAATFDDIEAFAGRCRFRDCRHEGEPGCAVRAQVSEDRLLNYHKLLRDARRSQQTPLERTAQRGKWRVLGKAGEARAREKRG